MGEGWWWGGEEGGERGEGVTPWRGLFDQKRSLFHNLKIQI